VPWIAPKHQREEIVRDLVIESDYLFFADTEVVISVYVAVISM